MKARDLIIVLVALIIGVVIGFYIAGQNNESPVAQLQPDNLLAAAGGNAVLANSVAVDLQGGDFAVDSFFDVFYTDIFGDPDFAVDSFFDVVYVKKDFAVDSFFDVFTLISPDPAVDSFFDVVCASGAFPDSFFDVFAAKKGNFAVDSFFDVYCTSGAGSTFSIDSFFDVFYVKKDYAVDSFFDILSFNPDLGGPGFAVDSFFDVFTFNDNFAPDSFFDIFYLKDDFSVDSFFDIFTMIKKGGSGSTCTVDKKTMQDAIDAHEAASKILHGTAMNAIRNCK